MLRSKPQARHTPAPVQHADMLDAIPRRGRAQVALLAVVCFSLGVFITLSSQRLRPVAAPQGDDEPAFRDLAGPRKEDWWTKMHEHNVDVIAAADKADVRRG